MAKLWVIVYGLITFTSLWTNRASAYPAPFQGFEDEDELDSYEEEFMQIGKTITKQLGIENMTQAELAQRATTYLAQYFSALRSQQIVTELVPVQAPTPNQNPQTIVIRIVTNTNGTQNTDTQTISLQLPEAQQQLIFNMMQPQPPATILPSIVAPAPPPAPVGALGIEDAIFEALSVAQEGETTAIPLRPDLPESAVIHEILNTAELPLPSTTTVKDPTIEDILEQAESPAKDTILNGFLLNPYIPPERLRPSTENPKDPMQAIANLFGSIAQGNLGGVVQNTLKIAGNPVIQNFVTCGLFDDCDKRLQTKNYLSS